MKKILIFIAIILAPTLLKAQVISGVPPHTIDRAMSIWARDRINANLNSIFGQVDSSRIIFNYRDSTITILKYADFDLEDGWAQQEGRTGWNDDDKTLEVGLDAGSVLQLGQEIHVRTLNNYGDTIFDGKAVRISGASGSRPTIALGNNNSDTAYSVMGLSTQEILDGRVGYSTMIGLVRGLNTAAWPAGTILWLDSIDGGLTSTRPIAPHIAVVMGVVVRSNAEEGIIGIKVIAVPRLAWLSDVKAQGDQTHWDILYWNEDSLRWELNDGVIVLDSIAFGNGASIDNSETDTLFIEEVVTKIEGELFVTGHVYEGEHASGLTYVSTPGTQTIGTGGTFERLNEGAIAYTGDHLHEFTHDDGRLTYTSAAEISMTIAATVSVESGEVTQEVQLRIAKNGTTIAGTNMQVEFTAVNGNASVSLFWMVDMNQNDYIEVWGTSDTNGDDIIINNLTMGLTKH